VQRWKSRAGLFKVRMRKEPGSLSGHALRAGVQRTGESLGWYQVTGTGSHCRQSGAIPTCGVPTPTAPSLPPPGKDTVWVSALREDFFQKIPDLLIVRHSSKSWQHRAAGRAWVMALLLCMYRWGESGGHPWLSPAGPGYNLS